MEQVGFFSAQQEEAMREDKKRREALQEEERKKREKQETIERKKEVTIPVTCHQLGDCLTPGGRGEEAAGGEGEERAGGVPAAEEIICCRGGRSRGGRGLTEGKS